MFTQIRSGANIDLILETTLIGTLRRAVDSHPYHTKQLLDNTRVDIIKRIYIWSQSTAQEMFLLEDVAGAGKSTLAAHLGRHWDDGKLLGGCQFYNRNTTLKDVEVWPSLAASIADSYPPVRPYITEALVKTPSLAHLKPLNQLTELIIIPLQRAHAAQPRFYPLHIVLDALDECDTVPREILLSGIPELRKVPWLKLFVTCRSDATVPVRADPLTKLAPNISEGLGEVRDDIKLYIRDRLGRLSFVENGDRRLAALGTKAGKLFVWAQMACDTILDAASPEERLKELLENTNPVPLTDLYLTILKRVAPPGGADANNVRHLLQALIAAPAPLSVEHLSTFLNKSTATINNLLDRLASLLTRDSNSNDAAIRFVHITIPDLLVDRTFDAPYRIDPLDGHELLFFACTKLMANTTKLRPNMLHLKKPQILQSDISDLQDRVAEHLGQPLRYVALHWPSHARHVVDKAQVRDVIMEFFAKRLLCWIEALVWLDIRGIATRNLLELGDTLLSKVRPKHHGINRC